MTSTTTPPRGVRLPIADDGWFARAVCLDHDAELWFAAPGSVHEAIALCQTCPVIAECARFADRTNARYGVWGGVDREAGRSPGKPAGRVALRDRVLDVISSDPGATLADVADQLEYGSASSLERCLYKTGDRDLVHQLTPGRRRREDIESGVVSPHLRRQRKYRPPQHERV